MDVTNKEKREMIISEIGTKKSKSILESYKRKNIDA